MVTVEPLQGSTWCSSACTLSPAELLVCCQDALLVYTAAGDSEAGQTVQLLQRLPLFDVVSAIIRTHDDQILAVTGDGRCSLLSLERGRQQPQLAAQGAVSWSLTYTNSTPAPPLSLRERACAQLSAPSSLTPPTRREDGICCSAPLHTPQSDSVYVGLSVFHDVVHVLRLGFARDSGSPGGERHEVPANCLPEDPVAVEVLAFDLKKEALLGMKPSKGPCTRRLPSWALSLARPPA